MHNEIHEHSKNMTLQEKVKNFTQNRTGDKYGTSQLQSASLVFPLVRTSGNFDKQISKNICLIITAILRCILFSTVWYIKEKNLFVFYYLFDYGLKID